MTHSKHPAGPLPPLSSFARHRVTMVRLFCGALACRHVGEVPIATLIDKLGPDATKAWQGGFITTS